MSRVSKLSSVLVACSVFAVSAALIPTSAMAKGGGSHSMGGSSSSHKMGNNNSGNKISKMPISKNVGNLPTKKFDKSSFKKGEKFPKTKNYCNPKDPHFCHHDFCCHPHCVWVFPWLCPTYCQEVVCVERCYNEPLYTLYYETDKGIRVYSRYELPSENSTLYKTEKALDKSATAWWLISSNGQLVDTNTAEKAEAIKGVAIQE